MACETMMHALPSSVQATYKFLLQKLDSRYTRFGDFMMSAKKCSVHVSQDKFDLFVHSRVLSSPPLPLNFKDFLRCTYHLTIKAPSHTMRFFLIPQSADFYPIISALEFVFTSTALTQKENDANEHTYIKREKRRKKANLQRKYLHP